MESLIQRLGSLKTSNEYYNLASGIWDDTINLSSDILGILEVEIQALIDYFYATELMIRCKEAAVRVSPPVWEEIESRILTVPAD